MTASANTYEHVFTSEKADVNHGVISNDDLFYDPKIDDENQKWVDEKRRRYQPNSNQINSGQADDNSSTPVSNKNLYHTAMLC